MIKTSFVKAVLPAIVTICALLSSPASAQDASFKPKQITVYVGFSPTTGIGYDTYARTLAMYYGKYLPGTPSIVVANKPGGGSMTAANYIAQVAAKDGTEIAIVGRGVGMDKLVFGQKSAARFDATQLEWLGSMNNEVSGFFLADTSPVQTLEDVFAGKPLIVGSAGTSSDLHIFSIVVNSIFGAKMKIITGYPGTNEILLSLERGEVDGLLGYSWAAARTGSGEMLRTGKLKNILQLGLRKHPDLQDLPLIIKSDVQGSMEAIRGTLEKLATDEVKVNILHSAVGEITESDVTLAKASQAIIIGFNVRANPQAREAARRDGVAIRYYSIIYDVVDDIKATLGGLLAPTLREKYLGLATIREVFSITKVGKVAGCMVTEGIVKRGSKVRLLRDNVVIHEGSLKTLKRMKDEVKEVREGYECGMAFENYTDIKVGDSIECFEIEEIIRTL